MIRKILALLFLVLMALASYQCARRGAPTGGPKDEIPPRLVRADPPNESTNLRTNKIRLYFDELVKLKEVQEQLIVSPPLKYRPQLTPQGGASKFIEILIKDTLLENTTYTFNFGQSIVDNNEENPLSFFTYVFSTGPYLDSLELAGAVKDAYNKQPDNFVSIMLYKIDSSYTDSTVYKRPPDYLTNTLDSAIIFRLKNLKEGNYALIGLKDAAKDNLFDQKTDKIAFVQDTISLPTDSIYLMNLFREIPDYGVAVPSMVSQNRISFGYYGDGKNIEIQPLTVLPDTVKTLVTKEYEKDTLNYWFTPFEMDSIVFTVKNEQLKVIDTFTVKNRKVGLDSLVLTPNQRGNLEYGTPLQIRANTPLVKMDTSKINVVYQDSLSLDYRAVLDTTNNRVDLDFERLPDTKYAVALLPGAIEDFFGATVDSTMYTFNTKKLSDYGNLSINLSGDSVRYPLIVQLTNEKGETQREIYATEPQVFEFKNIPPANYLVRVIFDTNENRQWDTGSFLKKEQPERVSYYPNPIEVRANWEKIETFTLLDTP